jgi:hypothetical protein
MGQPSVSFGRDWGERWVLAVNPSEVRSLKPPPQGEFFVVFTILIHESHASRASLPEASSVIIAPLNKRANRRRNL